MCLLHEVTSSDKMFYDKCTAKCTHFNYAISIVSFLCHFNRVAFVLLCVFFFPKALRRVLPENPLNTDTSTLTLRHSH